MSIVRIQKRENPYVQIDKRPLENTNLSWKAKGLLAYLLSRPDNWKISVQHLAEMSTDGIDSVRSTFKELELYGHAELIFGRGDNGQMTGKEWVIYEEPKNVTDVGKTPTSGKSVQRETPTSGKSKANNKENSNNKENNDLEVVCEQTTIVSPKLKERLNCKNSKHEAAVVEIVDYFNLVTGRKTEYHSKGQLKYLLHWLNEGYAVDDFKAVIDYKTNIFKGTPNENYIALDTYCRFDKFEENLTKAKNSPQATTDASLADCELSQEQAEQYAKTREYILANYPNLKEVRFFSHREFLAFSTNDVNDFLPIAWRVKATERKMKDWKLALMDKLNTNVFERKACGSLYGYIKDGIREQLKKEN